MRRARGQAMAEYAILLALVTGANFFRGLADHIGQQPLPVLVGSAAVVLLGGWLLLRR
jgi:hypothetical protein